jgi:hypothetical protein
LLLARLALTVRGFPPRAPVLRHYYLRLLFVYWAFDGVVGLEMLRFSSGI